MMRFGRAGNRLVRRFGDSVSNPHSLYSVSMSSEARATRPPSTNTNLAAHATKLSQSISSLSGSRNANNNTNITNTEDSRNGMSKRLTRAQLGSNGGTRYLSYYDVNLTVSDVKALKNEWLTDSAICFWEEWLEREILSSYPQARIVLLRPSMVMMLTCANDVMAIAPSLPNFDRVTHIFLPINDNSDASQADGGTHWSLLLVSVIDGVAFHYDSLGGSNFYAAYKASDRLSKILGVGLRFHTMKDCPQQANSIDCGVFVCILMRHLLIKRLLNASSTEKVSMAMAGKYIDSHNGRREMLKIVEALHKEAQRRKSDDSSRENGKSRPDLRVD